MVKSAFLRSINIQLDVEHPDRIEHFRPTSKSARLLKSMLRDRRGEAVSVVAPYGSGKSITAAYAGALIENHPAAETVLRLIEPRLMAVDPSLGAVVDERRNEGRRGLFVPLYGHVASTPQAVKAAVLAAMRRCKLGRRARTIEHLPAQTAADVLEILANTSAKLESAGFDRLVLVWDEFGRHLQGLISEGRPEELDLLQVLAEGAARSGSVPVSLVLLLHRSLLGYAGNLPAGIRREWAKIEGRFETLQYIDDSSELYELVASLVDEDRGSRSKDVDFGALAGRATEVGLFPDVSTKRLCRILEGAYPLEPTTLFLLPRVAARVAQNERTIFSFLQSLSLEEATRPGALYDYFRGDFREDAGPGGTQRAWLETESAIHKVQQGSVEEEVLKCAFLLGLGRSGERAHVTRGQLAFGLTGFGPQLSEEAIENLISQKLLLYRKHSDHIAVWHGTDADLRGRLADERKRTEGNFRLAPFLAREAPPPVWRPVEYNARVGIRRYLEAEYVNVEELGNFWDQLRLEGGWKAGCDGRVLYVLPETDAQFQRAIEISSSIDDPRLFIAIAEEASTLRDAALDLWCLLRMQGDRDLISSDPLVKAELDHLTDDARTGLQPFIERLHKPQGRGIQWIHAGESLRVTSVPQLRRIMSEAMDHIFEYTPEIDSEMVVRRSPSSIVINARKKVELGLLERYGQLDLGIEGNFADKAIFRSVFIRSGLYRSDGGHWRLATPEEIQGPGLRAVWEAVRTFFTEPGKNKSFRAFINRLLDPPFGVRQGLIPLFVSAGIKAFPSAIVIRRNGQFVDDLLPSVIEDIAKSPGEFAVDVVGLSEAEREYLVGVLRLFSAGKLPSIAEEGDLLRACMEAVLGWRQRVPPAAASSRFVSAEARAFENELIVPDPVRLFLEVLPRLVGKTPRNRKALLAGVARLRDELASVEELFENEATEALSQVLVSRGFQNGAEVREQAARWAANFPKSFGRRLPDRVSQGVLSRLRTRYPNDAALMNALAALLVGRPIRQWDDATVPSFRRQLRNAMEVIESTALGMRSSRSLDRALHAGLVALAEARTSSAAEQLADIVGGMTAASHLEDIARTLRERHASSNRPKDAHAYTS